MCLLSVACRAACTVLCSRVLVQEGPTTSVLFLRFLLLLMALQMLVVVVVVVVATLFLRGCWNAVLVVWRLAARPQLVSFARPLKAKMVLVFVKICALLLLAML